MIKSKIVLLSALVSCALISGCKEVRSIPSAPRESIGRTIELSAALPRLLSRLPHWKFERTVTVRPRVFLGSSATSTPPMRKRSVEIFGKLCQRLQQTMG